ncbi:MAG: TAXI family TRAP transporter solute-binding subunit [Burkholderiales bacterium]|nr:MAG: TAXI family TRAP transporter solute-binding subunit [Burkholderiales bacterium]
MKMNSLCSGTRALLFATALSAAPVAGLAADVNISIGSCPVGCTAYTWSAGIADVINRNVEGVRMNAEETKGYVANIKLLQRGELEASMATSLSAYQAYAATGNYKGGEKGQILSWMAIVPVAMHVVTLADSPVKTLADLKGKRVGMGQPGGVSMLDADLLMETLGLKPDADFKPFRVRLGNMVSMLADGNLDAALWNGSFPLPPVKKLTAERAIRLVPVSDELFTKLQAANPPYFRLNIPGKLYDGVDQPTPTYGLSNGMVILKSVPEDLVYRMTKAIFENLDKLKGVHPAFGRVTKETVLNGFGAPLHPGALKYYREIGVPGIEEFVKRTSQ